MTGECFPEGLAEFEEDEVTEAGIAAEDARMLERQRRFRVAARALADGFAACADVEAVVLFGSVAVPLWREVPRFNPFRRARVELWHECGDIDLAVWVSRTDGLTALNRARVQALQELQRETSPGVSPNEVDVFLFEVGTDRHLGRLCRFRDCPRGRRECYAAGCGAVPFLRQIEEFTLRADALAEGRVIRLFDRGGHRHGADDMPVGRVPGQ